MMNMYGTKAQSYPQKALVTLLELILLALAGAILFGPWGNAIGALFDWPAPPNLPLRRIVIMAFSVIIFGRMVFTMFRLMKRALPWSEALTIPFAFALYYVGYAILGLKSAAPLGLFDYLAVVLFLFGCYLNTASELQRDRFKAQPENKGKLYTEGLFSWSMHINFFGDILWVAAYAILTHNIWSSAVVVAIFCFFAFFNVPKLDAYLAERYGAAFSTYAARTKTLVPLIW